MAPWSSTGSMKFVHPAFGPNEQFKPSPTVRLDPEAHAFDGRCDELRSEGVGNTSKALPLTPRGHDRASRIHSECRLVLLGSSGESGTYAPISASSLQGGGFAGCEPSFVSRSRRSRRKSSARRRWHRARPTGETCSPSRRIGHRHSPERGESVATSTTCPSQP
jgi:hypothetical protein